MAALPPRVHYLFIRVHELFDPLDHPFAWFATVAQVCDEARIGHGKAAELGLGQTGDAEKPLNAA
jgi:hypothetical protein